MVAPVWLEDGSAGPGCWFGCRRDLHSDATITKWMRKSVHSSQSVSILSMHQQGCIAGGAL
jgi:hypothetical protein